MAMKNIIIDTLILGGGILGQVDIGSTGLFISKMAPSALLGVGLIWAIRRGDGAIKELRDTRDKHERAIADEREEFKKILRDTTVALTTTTETMTRVNRTIEHCEQVHRRAR